MGFEYSCEDGYFGTLDAIQDDVRSEKDPRGYIWHKGVKQ